MNAQHPQRSRGGRRKLRWAPPSSVTTFSLSLALVVAILTIAAPEAVANAASTGSGSESASSEPASGTESDAADGTEAEADAAPEAEFDEAEIEQLQAGAAVYSQTCSSCHQPGGLGLSGQYPPLKDNPNVADADYVMETINNGRQGEIEVAGQTYNGVMPSFSTLAEEDVAAVVAYLQNGLDVPGNTEDAEVATGPVANAALPRISLLTSGLAFTTFILVLAVMFAPFVLRSHDRLQFPLLDAWLRSLIIVIAVVVGLVLIPNALLTSEPVGRMDRIVQDLLGAGVFGGGLLVVLAGLWLAHREAKV